MKTYQQVMVCPCPHCCCHSEIQSRNVWLFYASWLFELQRHYSGVSLLQLELTQELTEKSRSSNSPVTSSVPGDQSSTASSKASSSVDTKLSNKVNPAGKERDPASSQGTAQTTQGFRSINQSNWLKGNFASVIPMTFKCSKLLRTWLDITEIKCHNIVFTLERFSIELGMSFLSAHFRSGNKHNRLKESTKGVKVLDCDN